MKHDGVGSEHILLGLLLEGQGVAAVVLRSLGVSIESARAAVLREVEGAGGEPAASGS
jgi:ATP-dependent Clp protease ATP-binding subunit ClpC